MPTATLSDAMAEEVIARWLSDTPLDGWDNPAGDLFTSGEYALQEITMTTNPPHSRCSSCTGSARVQCC